MHQQLLFLAQEGWVPHGDSEMPCNLPWTTGAYSCLWMPAYIRGWLSLRGKAGLPVLLKLHGGKDSHMPQPVFSALVWKQSQMGPFLTIYLLLSSIWHCLDHYKYFLARVMGNQNGAQCQFSICPGSTWVLRTKSLILTFPFLSKKVLDLVAVPWTILCPS